MADHSLQDIGRLPSPGDNAAIAARRLPAGTRFRINGRHFRTSHDVLEGHRFAVREIARGAHITSWGLPFGIALTNIRPGDYLCNAGILEAMAVRELDVTLPEIPNFEDFRSRFELDEPGFVPGSQVTPVAHPGYFSGYARPGGRGVGTRNHIVVLGTTSRTASFCKTLAERCRRAISTFPQIDGIAAVAHTEGGEPGTPNNLDLLLRTLAGFVVHPNVGAVIAVDYGSGVLNNRALERFMRNRGYPLDHVAHAFFQIDGDFDTAMRAAQHVINGWMPAVAAMARSRQPLSALRIALQCGGSDAFSGVSGNPLAGLTAREIIRHGGSAALAETDELIGAETYLLANTRDLETARRFVDKIARFRELIAWHGHTAEGNTSGGNKLRGLYNNALKSIGAARKKDPDVRLDYVIDYAQPMDGPGFYFMDSPGNDLESIAGQVAAGCNMIYFVTGNGSITNFPFVPTIKFMTTTERWKLLSADMDINAGRYQDGTPMDELGKEAFAYTVDVASGRRSVGERAGHSQVSIWRNWRQTGASQLREIQQRPAPDGEAILKSRSLPPDIGVRLYPADGGHAADRVGLIVPTSLCAGQIALRIACRLNADKPATSAVNRFVALPHTEGCGASSGDNEAMYLRTLAGHLAHPFVVDALLLEHGCEHTHNDLVRHSLREHGLDTSRFGYASIQLDGGIDKVQAKVANWFTERLVHDHAVQRENSGLGSLCVALISTDSPVPAAIAQAFARLANTILDSGGTVVLPQNASLLASQHFLDAMRLDSRPAPSVDYGQVCADRGLHVMATPTRHVVETLTGLGGAGVQLMLAHADGAPLQGHPMVPLLQVGSESGIDPRYSSDIDYLLGKPGATPADCDAGLLQLVCDTASGDYSPRRWVEGNTDFQFTRGLLGVSL